MSRTLDLPLTSPVNGLNWNLHSVDFETPDGRMSIYLYATSIEHALIVLSDLRTSTARVEQVMGQYDE